MAKNLINLNRGSLCHKGLVKDYSGHLVKQNPFVTF